jgi:DHA2 family multidrug resistance protein
MTTAGAPAALPPGARRTLITICAMSATIMQALDTTIANVALPYMQARSAPRWTRSTGC